MTDHLTISKSAKTQCSIEESLQDRCTRKSLDAFVFGGRWSQASVMVKGQSE